MQKVIVTSTRAPKYHFFAFLLEFPMRSLLIECELYLAEREQLETTQDPLEHKEMCSTQE